MRSPWPRYPLARLLKLACVLTSLTAPIARASEPSPADSATATVTPATLARPQQPIASADSARAVSSVDSARTSPALLPRPAAPKQPLGMVDTVIALPTVHVQADRTRESVRDAATIVRIERGHVARFQPSTVADALLSTPGVELVRVGPWASNVSMRGLGGERVLVLVDGVRLQTGRGHGAQLGLIPVDRIESVEVMPGAGGVQFGSDALAGVVRMSTGRALLGERGFSASLTGRSGGPGNEHSGYSALRYKSPRIGAELSGAFGALGALVTPTGREPNSSYREDDFAARVEADVAGSTLVLDHARHAARDVMLPGFNTDAGNSALYPLQSRDATRLDWQLGRAGLRPQLRMLAVEQRYHTGFVEQVRDSQFIRGRYVADKLTRADDRVGVRALALYPTVAWGRTSLFAELRRETTAGPRFTDITVVNTTSGEVTSSTRSVGESVPDARRMVWGAGAFTGLEWKGFHFETGGRYDHVRAQADSTPESFTSRLDVTDQRLSYEAGLSRSWGAFTPYARIASGFRAPNLEERYYNDELHAGMRLFGNPDLRAERSRNVDLGVRVSEWAPGHISRARLSVYRSRIDDLVALVYLGQLYRIPRFQLRNLRNATLDGIEGEIGTSVGGVRAEVSASFPRGRDLSTGAAIASLGAAHVTTDLVFPLRQVLPNGSLTTRARWTDATSGGDVLARHAHWTGTVELAAVHGSTRFAFVVQNVTNTLYREPLGFVDEAGRKVMFAVRHELQWAGR